MAFFSKTVHDICNYKIDFKVVGPPIQCCVLFNMLRCYNMFLFHSSFASGISLLGFPAEIYVFGMQFYPIFIGFIISGFIISYIFLPVYHNLHLTSSYEVGISTHKSSLLFVKLIFYQSSSTLIYLNYVSN